MTPEQINRLIAESGLFKYPDIVPIGGKWRIHRTDTPYYEEFYEDFDPYHRIEHAMMALEKLKPKCRQIIIEYKSRFYSNGDSWWVTIQLISGVWISQIMADTAPAAICLACIEAGVNYGTILHHNSDH